MPEQPTAPTRSGARALRRPRPRLRAALVIVLVTASTLALLAATGGARSPARAAARHPPATARKLLFGLGPEADGARKSPLVRAAPVRMLSSWYNGPSDLGWMTAWRGTEVARDYAAGYALHLIVWSGGPQTQVPTRYGTACGQAYPLSAQFLQDMERLARTFAGPRSSRLYVTLFTEFQTYACHGNEWSADPHTTAYFEALKDQYRAALAIFHRLAPNGAVSLGWGGWQARWDDPAKGGGRSLFAHFADVMRESDFESFEVIDSGPDVSDILGMTRALERYGPVMLAYYKPPHDSPATVQAHLKAVLAPRLLSRLTRARVFALSLMDDSFLSADPVSLAIVRDAVKRFGCGACGRVR